MKTTRHPLQSYNYLQIVEGILVSIHCLPFDLCKENKIFKRNSWNTCLPHRAWGFFSSLSFPESHRKSQRGEHGINSRRLTSHYFWKHDLSG